MKHLLIFAVCFLSLTLVSCDGRFHSSYLIHFYLSIFLFFIEQCGNDASWDSTYNTCKYRCTPDGVTIDCTKPGCRCYDFEQYFNLDTNSCSEVNCENQNCAGLQNEAFFTCEPSSRDICRGNDAISDACRQGCMCKDGFCRQNGVCVPRNYN